MNFLLQHDAIAVRLVDVARLIPDLDVSGYSGARVFIADGPHLRGFVDLNTPDGRVTASQLATAVATQLPPAAAADPLPPLPASVSAAIVVATYDRPDELRRCLQHLTALRSPRPVEIIVVDNHPASGLTPPIVADFPGVVLVTEPRQGLAYARNAGFLACRSDIAVATDDDVTVPPDWLEKLLPAFADPDVMVVTGNTLPLELETTAQRLYELYGGLGRGFERKICDTDWFRSIRWTAVPTWRLGATANAAFRTTMFRHPDIGLMDEALGPGMPSGVGEDTYLFYKALKAGYKLIYEPSAYVWHCHRRDEAALHRQIFAYSKGHIAYHLTTLLRDGDWRALLHAFILMPPWRLLQVAKLLLAQLRGTADYDLRLLLLEIRGNLLGPWALWRSRQRVQREGRSNLSPQPQSLDLKVPS